MNDCKVQVVRISTAVESELIYALRYTSLLDSDADPGNGPLVRDEYDGTNHCPLYGIKSDDGTLFGSIRPCILSEFHHWARIPAMDLYPDEVSRVSEGNAIVQSSHFVVDSAFRGVSLRNKLQLFGAIVRTARDNGALNIVTIIRNLETQIGFYSRLGFTIIGPPRIHPVSRREGVLIGVAMTDLEAICRESRLFRPILDFANQL